MRGCLSLTRILKQARRCPLTAPERPCWSRSAVVCAASMPPSKPKVWKACSPPNKNPASLLDSALGPLLQAKVALCQLLTTDNKEQNINTAMSAIQEAASQGANMVVLPEMWNCPYSNDSFPTFAEDIEAGSSQSAAAMADAAQQHGVTLVAGSIPERHEGHLYNTCLVYNSKGQSLARFRKMHLFDIDIPGKITFRESDTLTAGQNIAVVDTDVGRIGLGICYDIRFPELAMIYARQGVQLILYPGAFNMTTGPAHWELLAKARAVDNQLFVGVCSPARNMEASYHAWGHSMLVGPFGQILASADHTPVIIYADLDFQEVDERRKGMPLATQKRYDLYELTDKTGSR